MTATTDTPASASDGQDPSRPDCEMAPAAAEPLREEIVALVADDLRAGVRNMRARAADCDIAAENYEESARRERALAEEFKAKAAALTALLPLIGVDMPPEEAAENSDFPRPV